MQEWKGKCVPIKAWVDGVPVESEAINQLRNVAALPFVFKHVAAMPDVHVGVGTTVGTVIATQAAVIPSCVGVDIGCGMIAVQTTLTASDIPEDKRADLRKEIETLVPTGRTNHGGRGDRGAWGDPPQNVINVWRNQLEPDFEKLLKMHPGIRTKYGVNHLSHLGTLGTGNHFIEVCLDLEDKVWIMLHSGSRGVGNRIGVYFIKLAKKKCLSGSHEQCMEIDKELNAYFKTAEFRKMPKGQKKRVAEQKREETAKKKRSMGVKLPHPDLAYFEEGTPEFNDYMFGVQWAQRFAFLNRMLMLESVQKAVKNICGKFDVGEVVNCHHNYVEPEYHFGEGVLVTRKGAIRAGMGEKGIIPGSMGARSYIVEGLGNKDSFCSASHGAGRVMSRSAAKKTFTLEDHLKATEGIECAKDKTVLDETPAAYKDIDTVMAAEVDLVKPIHELRQIICVKGSE